jgi:hypothetical protein
MVGEAMSTTAGEVMPTMVGDAASMSMVGDAVSMSMVDDVESTTVAGDEPSTLVGADELMEAVDTGESMMVGEGAGESVDPDSVGPTMGAN